MVVGYDGRWLVLKDNHRPFLLERTDQHLNPDAELMKRQKIDVIHALTAKNPGMIEEHVACILAVRALNARNKGSVTAVV